MKLDMNMIQSVAMDWGIKILAVLLIFLIGKGLVRLFTNLTHSMMIKAKVDETLAKFLANIIYSLGFAFVIIAVLSQIGVNTASLVAVLGAAGLAVGLALQGSLANFAAGVMIIIFKPFKLGDFIEAGGTIGSVEDIGIFCTTLNHPDNRRIVVPNNSITSSNISNFTSIDKRRVDLKFSISYGDNMQKAKDVLKELCENDPRVLKDQPLTIGVVELADNSVNIVCRPFVKPGDYWAVWFDLTEKGKLTLEAAGCTIPFPQRDVHLHQDK
jgi:small conductance mechanosensitive channel